MSRELQSLLMLKLDSLKSCLIDATDDLTPAIRELTSNKNLDEYYKNTYKSGLEILKSIDFDISIAINRIEPFKIKVNKILDLKHKK